MASKKNQEETALVPSSDAGLVLSGESDYGDDAGRGFENQTSSDVILAWLKLLQGESPELKSNDDFRQGEYYNTLTQSTYKKDVGFPFVPAVTKHAFAEWAPRDAGGGIRGNHEIDSQIVLEAIRRGFDRDEKGEEKYGSYTLPNGNKLSETFYLYGVICTESGLPDMDATIAFDRTKIRPYRVWNTTIKRHLLDNGTRPPLFANLIRVKTVIEKSKKNGKEYYVPKLMPEDPRGVRASLLKRTDPRFLAARLVADMVAQNRVVVNAAEQDDDVVDADTSGTFQ